MPICNLTQKRLLSYINTLFLAFPYYISAFFSFNKHQINNMHVACSSLFFISICSHQHRLSNAIKLMGWEVNVVHNIQIQIRRLLRVSLKKEGKSKLRCQAWLNLACALASVAVWNCPHMKLNTKTNMSLFCLNILKHLYCQATGAAMKKPWALTYLRHKSIIQETSHSLPTALGLQTERTTIMWT